MKKFLVTHLLLALIAGCQETPTVETDANVQTDGGTDATTVDAATTGDATDDAALADAVVAPGPSCVTQIPPGAQNLLLCDVAGTVQHVRIEGVAAPATHASAQLFIGLTAPTGSQTPLTAGQFKLQLYGGGIPAPAPQLGAYFGAAAVDIEGNHAFVRTPSTICFDLHDGAVDARAAFVLWRDGENGADCHDRTTLTLANAYGTAFAPANGLITKDASSYFYQASSVTTSPTVTLFDSLAVPNVPQPPGASCATSIATTATARVVELCEVEGAVQHVRIEGMTVSATHASAQLLVGFDTPPSQTMAPPSVLAADQWKLQIYGGGAAGPGSTLPPSIDTYFGTRAENIAGDHAFVGTASTICFDVHDGTPTTPPYFVLWRDGQNGADCEDFDTLTLATAYGMELAYGRTSGALDKEAPLYFYQTTHSATPTVTLFNAAALTPAEAAAGIACETAWTSDAYWQPLCRPAAGRARHIRIEDATSTLSSKYFYLVLNEPAAPIDPMSTAAPSATVAGDGRFIFSGGWSHVPASATWFRFNGGSTAQNAYQVGAAPLYSVPHDICIDLGTQTASTNLRVLFWVTGSGGADCEDFATLTAANALYDSSTAVTDTFWNAALGTAGLDFIKISGSTTGATLGSVVLSSEPAVY